MVALELHDFLNIELRHETHLACDVLARVWNTYMVVTALLKYGTRRENREQSNGVSINVYQQNRKSPAMHNSCNHPPEAAHAAASFDSLLASMRAWALAFLSSLRLKIFD